MLEMIRRIFKIAGRSRKKIIVGITFNILKSFFNGFMMFGVFWILLHLENLTPAIILQAFGVVLGSVLGRFFFQWMYDRTMSGTGYDIFRDYRLEIGEKLKQAPMGYFSEQNLGTIQTILTTTIADLEGYSMLAIEQMTSGVAMAALMSIMMFFFNPIIAILSLIGLLLGLLVLRWVRSRAAQYAPIYQEAQENLVSKSMEYIRGISVLRSFSKGEEGQREVRSAFQKKWDADYGQEKATAGVLRFYILVYKLMSCVLIAAAGLLFMARKISLPYCLTFLFCAFTVYSDLETMGNSAFLSKKINTELDRLEEVTNIPQMDTSTDKLETSHYDITLDHISFGYDKRQVIHDISLNIPEHTTCAIVGPSGSGKTTVARALQKKFGYNTMMISQDEIRRNILWVKDGVDTKALPLMIELMKYGYEHCDVVILEGIMYDEWYSPLFKTANELYGMDIYAYYFDIPFEETVRRHNTRDKKQEFGEEDMRRWWREKDFSSVFNEKIITSDIDADSIVEMIYIDSANEG